MDSSLSNRTPRSRTTAEHGTMDEPTGSDRYLWVNIWWWWSVISKIIELVVKSRLTEHLSTNNLLNHHQSAFCMHHSTETSFFCISITTSRTNSIRCQQISCLCFLNLSAEFDTIDHNILTSRLSSRFGITGTVIDYSSNLICSLVLSMLNVNIVSLLSIPFLWRPARPCSRSLLFIGYTIPLSSLISSLSLNHHLHVCRWCATFLFLSSLILQMYIRA